MHTQLSEFHIQYSQHTSNLQKLKSSKPIFLFSEFVCFTLDVVRTSFHRKYCRHRTNNSPRFFLYLGSVFIRNKNRDWRNARSLAIRVDVSEIISVSFLGTFGGSLLAPGGMSRARRLHTSSRYGEDGSY